MAYDTYLTIIVPAAIAFAVTYFGTRFLVSYMVDSGVTSIDHNKKSKPTLPSSGGVAVAFGFAVGILAYVFGDSFSIYNAVASIASIFATVIAVLMISFVGFLDDINVQREMTKSTGMMDYRKGLEQWQKPLLTIFGAIPLVAINAGVSIIRVPFLGAVNLGIIYPILVIPLAVVFASNAFNLLGGFDGIAAGSGLIASLGLFIYSIAYGSYIGTLVSGMLFAALLAFTIFTVYPAKILPGDSLSYAVGTILVTAMILGNMEAFGIIVFMPWIIEFLLHARKRFSSTDLGILRKDNTFSSPYGKKIYSWTHLIMNLKRCREWEVSLYMWFIELGFVIMAFAMKYFALL